MVVFEILQKTYRLIRNRWDTVARSKNIVNKTKEIAQSSGKLIQDVRADGIHFDDLAKLRDGWGEIWVEVENVANEVGAIGEKIEVNTLTEKIKKKI